MRSQTGPQSLGGRRTVSSPASDAGPHEREIKSRGHEREMM